VRLEHFPQKSWDDIEYEVAQLLGEMLYQSGSLAADIVSFDRNSSSLSPQDILFLVGVVCGFCNPKPKPFCMNGLSTLRRTLERAEVFVHGPASRADLRHLWGWIAYLNWSLPVGLPARSWTSEPEMLNLLSLRELSRWDSFALVMIMQ